MARPRVLLTGFGPFPGVAQNPSGRLAESLAAQSPRANWALHGHVLPTEWAAVTDLTPQLHDDLQPHVMIHFGVSESAEAIRVERSAHNRALRRADAKGALPTASAISADGQHRLDTRLPVNALAAHLRKRGHPANASRSCGRYLCNFLYYRSLEWAAREDRDALFVHVPMTFGHDALLEAAQETLGFVLDTLETRQ